MEFLQELNDDATTRHKALKLLKKMKSHLNHLENMWDDLDKGTTGKMLLDDNLHGERKALMQAYSEAIDVFADFMPGLEMTYKGE